MDALKAESAAIRKILHQDWDPIGCGVPEEEYDSYLWPVLALLQKGASRDDLAAYLRTAASESMSSLVPEARLARVLDKLMALDIARR